jgi:hypothetical protein
MNSSMLMQLKEGCHNCAVLAPAIYCPAFKHKHTELPKEKQ